MYRKEVVVVKLDLTFPARSSKSGMRHVIGILANNLGPAPTLLISRNL